MNGLSAERAERKERLLIRLIGAAILIIVLAIAYLTYRTLPATDPDPTVLPTSSVAPAEAVEPPAAPAAGGEDSTTTTPQPDPEHGAPPAPTEGSSQDDPAS